MTDVSHSKSEAFDFNQALQDLKAAGSISNAKIQLDLILSHLHTFKNSDDLISKQAAYIVKIGASLEHYGGRLDLEFYQSLINISFQDFRNSQDYYELALFYIHVANCFDKHKVEEKFLKKIDYKIQCCLDGIEYEKYGVEAGLRAHGAYYRYKAIATFRTCDYKMAYTHIESAEKFYDELILGNLAPEVFSRAYSAWYYLKNLKQSLYLRLRFFEDVIHDNELPVQIKAALKFNPNLWTQLFNAYWNQGNAYLYLGQIDEAIERFKTAELICQENGEISIESSLYLQTVQAYLIFAFSLKKQTKNQSEDLCKQLDEIINPPKSSFEAYYSFLLHWSHFMSLLSQDNDDSELERVWALALESSNKCVLDDFEEEWHWLKSKIKKSKFKNLKGIFKKSPYPLFRASV